MHVYMDADVCIAETRLPRRTATDAHVIMCVNVHCVCAGVSTCICVCAGDAVPHAAYVQWRMPILICMHMGVYSPLVGLPLQV